MTAERAIGDLSKMGIKIVVDPDIKVPEGRFCLCPTPLLRKPVEHEAIITPRQMIDLRMAIGRLPVNEAGFSDAAEMEAVTRSILGDNFPSAWVPFDSIKLTVNQKARW